MLRPRIHTNESTASLAAFLLTATITVGVAIPRAGRAVGQSRTLSRLFLFAANSDEIGARLLILVNVHCTDRSFGALLLLAWVAACAHPTTLFIVGSIDVVLTGDSLAIPVVLLAVSLIFSWRFSGLLHLVSYGVEEVFIKGVQESPDLIENEEKINFDSKSTQNPNQSTIHEMHEN